MKYKKASIVSLVLALALVIGVTTAFAAASAANATEQDGLTLGQTNLEFEAFDNSRIGDKDINLADSDNTDGFVQIVGGQTIDECSAINLNNLDREAATNLSENAQPMKITLISVSHDDERKFTPEEWSQILALIDEGKVSWED